MRTIFLILLLSLLISYSGCDPGGRLIVINNRSEEVQILRYDLFPSMEGELVRGPYNYGNVPAGATKYVGGIVYFSLDNKFRIESRNMSDEIVFSRDFTARELNKMKWTITIPAE